MDRRVHGSPSDLAVAVAHAVQERLGEVLAVRDEAHLCLTGGTIAAEVYRQLAASMLDVGGSGTSSPLPAEAWSRVHLWWGDERFVSAHDADRNDEAAMLALGPAIWDRAVRHPMPALPDGAAADGAALDEAAVRYAAEVADVTFDLCLLGMGPDGHVASLFPGHPELAATDPAVAVRNSPKPPPERISLTFPVINRSSQVWLVAAGAEKAAAAAEAQRPGSALPAAQVAGSETTTWWLDGGAASA